MKRGKSEYDWIPLWIDKWLWGSTRIELTLEERAVWTDLMALAGKDDGYIRANETTPYPLDHLANRLALSIDILQTTIEKCLKHKKLELRENDVLYITNWPEYCLSERHKRRLIAAFKEEAELPKKEKKLKEADPIDLALALELRLSIEQNNPKAKVTEAQQAGWADAFRLMRIVDKRELEDIRRVLKWSQRDSFWYKNIRSAEKLREQFDQLYLKMKDDPQTKELKVGESKRLPSDKEKKYQEDRAVFIEQVEIFYAEQLKAAQGRKDLKEIQKIEAEKKGDLAGFSRGFWESEEK